MILSNFFNPLIATLVSLTQMQILKKSIRSLTNWNYINMNYKFNLKKNLQINKNSFIKCLNLSNKKNKNFLHLLKLNPISKIFLAYLFLLKLNKNLISLFHKNYTTLLSKSLINSQLNNSIITAQTSL